MSTLNELVQRTIANKHTCFAVDANNRAYSYNTEPCPDYDINIWFSYGRFEFIGHFDLTCDWDDSLVNVTQLNLTGTQ